jgi:hypothetical protein
MHGADEILHPPPENWIERNIFNMSDKVKLFIGNAKDGE